LSSSSRGPWREAVPQRGRWLASPEDGHVTRRIFPHLHLLVNLEECAEGEWSMVDLPSEGELNVTQVAGMIPGERRDGVEDLRPGRHRQHRFPARANSMKVLYDDAEIASVRQAAAMSGLRPSSYVAAAALVLAEQVVGAAASVTDPAGLERAHGTGPGRLTPAQDRELLAELMQARLAVRRFGVNVNQIAAALNSGGSAPVWMERAIAGGERAVVRIDEAAALLTRRLGRARTP
jgi:hypothetical protein